MPLPRWTDPLAGVAEACYDKHGKVKNTQQVKTRHETTQKSNYYFLLAPGMGVC